jgi:hypothetical protein
MRLTRRRSIMPTEDSHTQAVIADLQAKLRASQVDYISLQAALSHESPLLAATDKDAEIARLKTKLEDLERNAAVSGANLRRLHAHEVEKLEQDIVDAQSAVSGARHEFAQVEAILRQKITRLSSRMQGHERIAAKLERITRERARASASPKRNQHSYCAGRRGTIQVFQAAPGLIDAGKRARAGPD